MNYLKNVLCSSFRMNDEPAPPDPAVTLFDDSFLRKYIRYGPEILTKSSSKFENYGLFLYVAISVIFSSFFSITFD